LVWKRTDSCKYTVEIGLLSSPFVLATAYASNQHIIGTLENCTLFHSKTERATSYKASQTLIVTLHSSIQQSNLISRPPHRGPSRSDALLGTGGVLVSSLHPFLGRLHVDAHKVRRNAVLRSKDRLDLQQRRAPRRVRLPARFNQCSKRGRDSRGNGRAQAVVSDLCEQLHHLLAQGVTIVGSHTG